MNHDIHLSIIIPVFNRPNEVDELLNSLDNQTNPDFEVVVVEDGSTFPCKEICEQYETRLNLRYLFKPNSGRSETRNFGMDRASGNYFIIFDSDCIMPPQYIEIVLNHLTSDYTDCFGGPDNADDSFSDIQKAINYSMTSIMTTGGIRGATKNVNNFSPRSFNMGISREVYEKVGGYKNMIGEDIDLSIRIKAAGFKTRLIKEAFVYHKRRVSLKKFFKQVNTFGKGRVLLHHLHPESLKMVHLLPAGFVLGTFLLLLLSLIFRNVWFLLPIGIYILAIFTESLIKNKKISIAFLSIAAGCIQLFGYGLGFLEELITGKASKKSQEKLYK